MSSRLSTAGLSGYTITETIREDATFLLQRALRSSDQRPVVLKSAASPHPAAAIVRQLENEYEIARSLVSRFVARPLALERSATGIVLVLEDLRGVPLAGLLGAPMEVGRFFRLALEMAAALADVHRYQVVHKDIRSDNIFVNLETGQVQLTGFGLASISPRAWQPAPLARIEGALAYVSPEQTGRMHGFVDRRTDLYSLGVTFYELLTGDLPFRADDPLGWVHCHLAQPPRPPDELVSSIPSILSQMVLRLLAKVPEERYQSASGLRRDLETCLARYEATGGVAPFAIGREDLRCSLRPPLRLHGREREVDVLRQAMDRVVDTGLSEVVLVSGYSGIGKSSLARELERPTIAAGGSFVSGKFDEQKRDVPYSTVVQAFGDVLRSILGQPEREVASWRERLRLALGVNARLMIDLIPDLELIVGPQPPVTPLPLAEARSRFNMVFQRFIGVFARPRRPLVLFLDDLQWADDGSIALLHHFAAEAEVRNLLIIGAYRDNEVGPGHPLALALEALHGSGNSPRRILLGPLSLPDVQSLAADALSFDPDRLLELARFVHDKTGGNPFFAHQFLVTLCQEGLLVLDEEAREWTWDIGRIRTQSYTDNVVDLTIHRVERLAPEAQCLLELAACAGSRFDHKLLASLRSTSPDAVALQLSEPVREALILHDVDAYRFMHDRIQQAVYRRIPEARRAEIHLAIGRALLARADPESIAERVFDVVNQLNLGSSLATGGAERRSLAELNLIAGRRAKVSTAYASAQSYLRAGLALLGERGWDQEPELCYQLQLELAACTYSGGDPEAARALLDQMPGRPLGRVAEAEIRRIEIDLYTSMNQLDEAVARGVAGLENFGLELSPHPSWEQVTAGYDRVWHQLGDRQIEDLIDLPETNDPEICAVQDLLGGLYAPAVNTDRNLGLLVYAHMVDLCLRHGNSDAAAFAYSLFGMALGPAFGRHAEGYRFGKLGYDLMERRQARSYRAQISFIFGDNTLYWTRHLRSCLAYLGVAFETAVETGALSFACYCCNHFVIDRLILGDPLEEVWKESERRLLFTRKQCFSASTEAIVGIQRLVENLRGRTASFSTFSGPGFDEAAYEAMMDRYPWAIVTCWYYIMKLEARVLSGDLAEALKARTRAGELLWASIAHSQELEYWFFGGLALAWRHDEAEEGERAHLLAELRAHEAKLAEWARSCAENFLCRSALLSAEVARIEGRVLDAMNLYDQAIRVAHDNGFVQVEAIADESAGRAYLAAGFHTIAAAYLREARSCYRQWGADGKVAQLERRFPSLVEPKAPLPTEAFPVRLEHLDLWAVLKSTQAISREIELPRLLEILMRTVLEQAGAERGCLVLIEGEELRVEAVARATPPEVLRSMGLLTASFPDAPGSILNYVRRSREKVIIDDAIQPNAFSSDRYLSERRPRSLLCMPIMRGAELLGMLYLENNLIAGAFTRDRFTVLELLASQAAISLENAMLFGALERSERQLRAIIDNTTALIYVKDRDGRFLLVNRRVEVLTGVSSDWLRGKTDHDLFPREVADVNRANDLKVLASGAALEVEEAAPYPDGLHTYISIKVPLVDAAGVPYAVCGISTEITQRIAAERERQRLLKEAQDALRIRDEFVSMASHELKTPLTPLRLQMQRIHRHLADPEAISPARRETLMRLLDKSDHHIQRVSRLIDDLLDVSRISGGRLSLNVGEVDLAALVRRVVEEFREELVASKCPLRLEVPPEVVGSWDPFRLEQVLVNLLTNAMKYGAGKAIRIRVSEQDVGPAEASMVTLSVEDEGIGIPKDAQARIFERFERAAPCQIFGGLGLGLYIAREIVTAHGGCIRVESEVGQGARFLVELPRRAPEDRP